MKKKYLIGLIIFVLLVFLILFGYYIFICMNNTIPKAEEVTGNEISNAITVENLQTINLLSYLQ